MASGASRAMLITALGTAVEHQQPARVAASILRDAVRLFAVTRTQAPGVTPISRWQFQTSYPTYSPWVELDHAHHIIIGLQRKVYGPFRYHILSPSYGSTAHARWPAAGILRFYQLNGGYMPGPLLALCTLAGLAGSILAMTRRNMAARSRGTTGGRDGDRSGGGDVEGLLERLHELRELEKGQFLERVEQFVGGQLCHGLGPSLISYGASGWM
jgi:hypothetical protein